MTGRRRRVTIEFEELLKASKALAVFDDSALSQGYARRSARLWRCQDGTYTARVVWRHPASAVATMTFSVGGIVLR